MGASIQTICHIAKRSQLFGV